MPEHSLRWNRRSVRSTWRAQTENDAAGSYGRPRARSIVATCASASMSARSSLVKNHRLHCAVHAWKCAVSAARRSKCMWPMTHATFVSHTAMRAIAVITSAQIAATSVSATRRCDTASVLSASSTIETDESPRAERRHSGAVIAGK